MKITAAKTIVLCAASFSFIMLPCGVDGFFFRSSSDESLHLAPEQASVILQRLSALDSTIADLTKRVEDQQIQIALLESRLQSSRSLADDECLWSFVNETGTPTCKANYHITAEKGLAVQGDSTFAGGTSTMTVNARVFFNNQTRFTAPTRFVDDVLFEDIVSFTDNVTFVDNVEFRQGANVTFNGLVDFFNRTSFNNQAIFNDKARFNEEVDFDRDVHFNELSDVVFLDTVTFKDNVVIDGPGRGKIAFTVQDNVEVKFKPKYDISFETTVNFYDDVNIKAKECSRPSGKGLYGSSCSSSDSTPELHVAGLATFESDVIFLEDIAVTGNVVASQNVTGARVAASISMTVGGVAVSTVGVCLCSPAEDVFAGRSITVGSISATGDISTQGGVSASTIDASSAITVGGADVSTGTAAGAASTSECSCTPTPDIFANEVVTVGGLIVNGEMKANGNVEIDGDIMIIPGNLVIDGNVTIEGSSGGFLFVADDALVDGRNVVTADGA